MKDINKEASDRGTQTAANVEESDRDFASQVVTKANLMGFGAYSQVEWCNMAARLGYIVLRLTAEAESDA